MARTCKDCAWYARAHYNGTPDDEQYDECECNWEVLHDQNPCKDFATVREK